MNLPDRLCHALPDAVIAVALAAPAQSRPVLPALQPPVLPLAPLWRAAALHVLYALEARRRALAFVGGLLAQSSPAGAHAHAFHLTRRAALHHVDR
ncbi:MAG TPA: hypothetical protein VFI62_18310, partial [Burkholderiales bacterium]|nr:hypothetical protein [Burkholderiales bacterium]